MTADRELLVAWAEGDVEAGNALFNRHFEPVYRFFRNKVGDAADDLVQVTFLSCLETRHRFRRDASFRTWLLSIARHKLYDRFREVDRDAKRFDPEVTSVEAWDASPSAVMADKAQKALLLAALRRIPINSQIALELYYVEGLRGPEIAEVLGIPEPTVRGRLKRGLEQLRQQLEGTVDAGESMRSVEDLEGWAASLRTHLNHGSTRDR